MHQLLGLRLRFCLRGKYSDVFNFIFQINLVDLFGQCSQQQLNASGRTLSAILQRIRKFNNLMQQIIFFKFVVYETKT